MTQVEFHTGIDDPLRFACRLLRKAHRQGARLLVTGPAATLSALDRELWVFDAQDFVPHRHVPAGQRADVALERTPIWLVEGETPARAPDILVNLDAEAPVDPARFARIIEIVSADPEATRRARRRWKRYEAVGLTIRHHAMADHGPARHPRNP